MKRLTLALVPDSSESSGYYLPGDTFGGHVNLLLSSSMKYTCMRVHFTGLVTTKVAKTEEQVYVLKQQVVLLGNANNATEYSLEKGQHTWPFQFTIPLQHMPSSGKYRHGTVKYSLTATLTSAGFMGGVQELKASQTIQLKDLINIRVTPYSDPVSITGSSAIKPDSRKLKDMAVATAKLSRAAYLRGQVVDIEIDLSHPSKISRNPGCYIQLVCRQNFYAGDHAKEYQETLVSRSEPLAVNSSTNTGKILAEVTIPDNALPTMNTTKIISVEYHLYILMDMRSKTGFFESRVKGKITKKLKTRLLSSPGGFQIEVPVTIGTLSDSLHIQKPSPFAQIEDSQTVTPQADSAAPSRGPSTSSSPSVGTSSAPMIPSSVSMIPIIVPPPPPPLVAPQKQHQHFPVSELPEYTEEEPWPRSNDRIRSRSVDNIHVVPAEEPPLPPLPPEATAAAPGTLSPPIPYYTRHRGSLPHISAHHNGAPSGSSSSSSSTSRANASTRSATAPAAVPPPTPPRPNVTNNSMWAPPGQGAPVLRNPQGYPIEKASPAPYRNIPLPINMSVEIPTAPRAVDLGLGPASPPIPQSQSYPSTASVMYQQDAYYQEQQQLRMQQNQQRIQQQQYQFQQSPPEMSHHSQHSGVNGHSEGQSYFNQSHHGNGPSHGQTQGHTQRSNNGKAVDYARNPHTDPVWTAPPQSMATAPPMSYHPVPLVPLEQVASGSTGTGIYSLPRPYNCHEG
ncbi:hypothetical protein BGX33_000942 [Mortierella sp. NVP41]|nr:hypothetical protein BGX33_000942 [Mortierella sp. NVP41]